MATQIRGNVQIMPGTITADRFISGLNLATAQLAEGASFLKRDGSVVMTATFFMGNNKISNLLDPTLAQDAATKNYVDTTVGSIANSVFKKDGSVVATGNFNMSSNRVTNLAEPVSPSDAATKNYVDLAVQGLKVKDSVRAATTANITLSGTQTIDGVALAAGDRVLVKNQTSAPENGIYVVATGAWSRAVDANTGTEIKGAFTFVEEGTTQADTGWVVSTDGNITLDTTTIAWVQFSSAGTTSAGNGLTKAGNTISVLLPANSGLSATGSGLQVILDGTTLTKTASGLKISDLGAGKILMGNASGVATPTTLSGDISVDANGVVSVTGALKNSSFIFGEIPSGSINGSNATFTLASVPVANSEALFYNGTRLIRGSGEDYTISGATITMVAYVPQPGDKVIVDYIK